MSTNVSNVERHVKNLLQENLTPDHYYHNLPHTLSVVDAVRLLSARHEISYEDCELLELAAWFHDTGYVKAYENHEAAGAEMAAELLIHLQHTLRTRHGVGNPDHAFLRSLQACSKAGLPKFFARCTAAEAN